MRSLALSAFALAILSVPAVTALAQAVPPDQSCGGLLCDMGVFGHKVAPAPATAVPVPAPVPAPRAVAAKPAPVADEPEAPPVRKKKRIAKLSPPKAPSPAAVAPKTAPVRAATATAPAVQAPVAQAPAPAAASAAAPVDLGYLGAGLAPPKPAAPVFRPIYQ